MQIKNSLLLGLWIALVPVSCNTGSKKTRIHQAASRGYLIYQQKCRQCHGKEGKGFRELYPPIDTAFLKKEKFAELICLIRYGSEGNRHIYGKNYSQKMPPNADLTKHEIRHVVTFLYNHWSNAPGRLVKEEEIQKALEKCR